MFQTQQKKKRARWYVCVVRCHVVFDNSLPSGLKWIIAGWFFEYPVFYQKINSNIQLLYQTFFMHTLITWWSFWCIFYLPVWYGLLLDDFWLTSYFAFCYVWRILCIQLTLIRNNFYEGRYTGLFEIEMNWRILNTRDIKEYAVSYKNVFGETDKRCIKTNEWI